MQSISSSAYSTYPAEYSSYIMDPANKIVETRTGGRGAKIHKYQDGTEWVELGNQQQQRFSGFLYLQNALKEAGSKDVLPAENRMALLDYDIIYLSKYYGDEKLNCFDEQGIKAKAILDSVGFTDTMMFANMRKVNGKIFIFDTEKSSFNSRVHEKIQSFDDMQIAIQTVFAKKLKGLSEEKKKDPS